MCANTINYILQYTSHTVTCFNSFSFYNYWKTKFTAFLNRARLTWHINLCWFKITFSNYRLIYLYVCLADYVVSVSYNNNVGHSHKFRQWSRKNKSICIDNYCFYFTSSYLYYVNIFGKPGKLCVFIVIIRLCTR